MSLNPIARRLSPREQVLFRHRESEQITMSEEKFVLTQRGYDQIKQQLETLEATAREERSVLNDSLNDKAGGDDDDADVALEFDSRRRKERMDEKIGYLRFVLDRAEIYEDPDPERVNTGERVTLWDFEAREEFQLDVLSSAEITARTNVGPGVEDASDSSPIGKALLGKRVGDIVEVETPNGINRYTVRFIEPIPED